MPRITVGFGGLLIVVGLAAYFGAGRTSITAMIPAFFGVPILLLGVLAFRDGMRKHAMHGAAGLALLGLLGSIGGLPKLFALLSGGAVARPTAAVVQSIMAVLCVAFLALAIRSFIAARRERLAQPAVR